MTIAAKNERLTFMSLKKYRGIYMLKTSEMTKMGRYAVFIDRKVQYC